MASETETCARQKDFYWCRRPDSNRDSFRYYPLKIACLPIPPRRRFYPNSSLLLVLLNSCAQHSWHTASGLANIVDAGNQSVTTRATNDCGFQVIQPDQPHYFTRAVARRHDIDGQNPAYWQLRFATATNSLVGSVAVCRRKFRIIRAGLICTGWGSRQLRICLITTCIDLSVFEDGIRQAVRDT